MVLNNFLTSEVFYFYFLMKKKILLKSLGGFLFLPTERNENSIHAIE